MCTTTGRRLTRTPTSRGPTAGERTEWLSAHPRSKASRPLVNPVRLMTSLDCDEHMSLHCFSGCEVYQHVGRHRTGLLHARSLGVYAVPAGRCRCLSQLNRSDGGPRPGERLARRKRVSWLAGTA